MKKIFQPIKNPLVKKFEIVKSPVLMRSSLQIQDIPSVRFKRYFINCLYWTVVICINR